MSTNGADVDGDVVMENNCIKDSESKINATPPGDEKNVSTVETPKAQSASGVGSDADANNPCIENPSLDSPCNEATLKVTGETCALNTCRIAKSCSPSGNVIKQ